MLDRVRERLRNAQQLMKAIYDKNHRELSFEVGDWVRVLLKLQTYRHSSVDIRTNKKLSARFFGLFKVLARVGTVAYKLELPESAKLHSVFHISYLKPFHGKAVDSPTLPTIQQEDFLPLSQEILDERLSKSRHELLVHWQGLSPAEASWLDAMSFTNKYPSFVFADKHGSQGMGNVMAQQASQFPITRVYRRFTHGRFKQKD